MISNLCPHYCRPTFYIDKKLPDGLTFKYGWIDSTISVCAGGLQVTAQGELKNEEAKNISDIQTFHIYPVCFPGTKYEDKLFHLLPPGTGGPKRFVEDLLSHPVCELDNKNKLVYSVLYTHSLILFFRGVLMVIKWKQGQDGVK